MDIYELRGKIIWLSLIGLQSFYTRIGQKHSQKENFSFKKYFQSVDTRNETIRVESERRVVRRITSVENPVPEIYPFCRLHSRFP